MVVGQDILLIFLIGMGGEQSKENSANGTDNKIVLKLRTRDIVLHYAFKMKATISDISVFPHQLEGLRLWDADVTLARYAILQSQHFRNKTVIVFKAGVGLAGISVAKWTDCKSIAMCQFRSEIVQTINGNCEKNGVKGADVFEVNLQEFHKYSVTYDVMLCTDLVNQGFHPQTVVNLVRKLVKVGGEAIIILPQRKQDAKKFLELVPRQEFKINNVVLTAEQYSDSPLYNKLQGEQEFSLIGNTNFYAITLHKIAEPPQIRPSSTELEHGSVSSPEKERSAEEVAVKDSKKVEDNGEKQERKIETSESKQEPSIVPQEKVEENCCEKPAEEKQESTPQQQCPSEKQPDPKEQNPSPSMACHHEATQEHHQQQLPAKQEKSVQQIPQPESKQDEKEKDSDGEKVNEPEPENIPETGQKQATVQKTKEAQQGQVDEVEDKVSEKKSEQKQSDQQAAEQPQPAKEDEPQNSTQLQKTEEAQQKTVKQPEQQEGQKLSKRQRRKMRKQEKDGI